VYCIAMFCCSTPTASDPSFSTTRYVPVSDCKPGDIQTGLWYKNAVLVGLPVYLVRRLQSVLNAAARLIYHMRSADHITDMLISLHWLRASQRIEYKVAVLTYKVLHGTAPRYLGPLVPVADLYKAGGHCVLPAPIALWCLPSGSLPSVAGLSRLLLHASGTPCQRRRRQLSR